MMADSFVAKPHRPKNSPERAAGGNRPTMAPAGALAGTQRQADQIGDDPEAAALFGKVGHDHGNHPDQQGQLDGGQ